MVFIPTILLDVVVTVSGRTTDVVIVDAPVAQVSNVSVVEAIWREQVWPLTPDAHAKPLLIRPF